MGREGLTKKELRIEPSMEGANRISAFSIVPGLAFEGGEYQKKELEVYQQRQRRASATMVGSKGRLRCKRQRGTRCWQSVLDRTRVIMTCIKM